MLTGIVQNVNHQLHQNSVWVGGIGVLFAILAERVSHEMLVGDLINRDSLSTSELINVLCAWAAASVLILIVRLILCGKQQMLTGLGDMHVITTDGRAFVGVVVGSVYAASMALALFHGGDCGVYCEDELYSLIESLDSVAAASNTTVRAITAGSPYPNLMRLYLADIASLSMQVVLTITFSRAAVPPGDSTQNTRMWLVRTTVVCLGGLVFENVILFIMWNTPREATLAVLVYSVGISTLLLLVQCVLVWLIPPAVQSLHTLLILSEGGGGQSWWVPHTSTAHAVSRKTGSTYGRLLSLAAVRTYAVYVLAGEMRSYSNMLNSCGSDTLSPPCEVFLQVLRATHTRMAVLYALLVLLAIHFLDAMGVILPLPPIEKTPSDGDTLYAEPI